MKRYDEAARLNGRTQEFCMNRISILFKYDQTILSATR